MEVETRVTNHFLTEQGYATHSIEKKTLNIRPCLTQAKSQQFTHQNLNLPQSYDTPSCVIRHFAVCTHLHRLASGD
jgi:hypothetical protein